MRYVVLLRGVNVGTSKRVDMKTLKKLFESIGYTEVFTYIKSGRMMKGKKPMLLTYLKA